MFACLACNIEFSTQLDLDRHVDSTHGGRVPRKRKERKFLATEQATEGGVRSRSIRSGYKKKPRSQKFSQDDVDRQVDRAVEQALEESQRIHEGELARAREAWAGELETNVLQRIQEAEQQTRLDAINASRLKSFFLRYSTYTPTTQLNMLHDLNRFELRNDAYNNYSPPDSRRSKTSR